MDNRAHECVIFFEIYREVSNNLTQKLFNQIFRENSDVFWHFWIERANRRIGFFYDNIDNVLYGVARGTGAKTRFANTIGAMCSDTLAKYGYRIIHI